MITMTFFAILLLSPTIFGVLVITVLLTKHFLNRRQTLTEHIEIESDTGLVPNKDNSGAKSLTGESKSLSENHELNSRQRMFTSYTPSTTTTPHNQNNVIKNQQTAFPESLNNIISDLKQINNYFVNPQKHNNNNNDGNYSHHHEKFSMNRWLFTKQPYCHKKTFSSSNVVSPIHSDFDVQDKNNQMMVQQPVVSKRFFVDLGVDELMKTTEEEIMQKRRASSGRVVGQTSLQTTNNNNDDAEMRVVSPVLMTKQPISV